MIQDNDFFMSDSGSHCNTNKPQQRCHKSEAAQLGDASGLGSFLSPFQYISVVTSKKQTENKNYFNKKGADF